MTWKTIRIRATFLTCENGNKSCFWASTRLYIESVYTLCRCRAGSEAASPQRAGWCASLSRAGLVSRRCCVFKNSPSHKHGGARGAGASGYVLLRITGLAGPGHARICLKNRIYEIFVPDCSARLLAAQLCSLRSLSYLEPPTESET
jgi:hypothetical protein